MEGFARFRGRRGQGTLQVSAVTRIETRLPPSCRGSGAANFFFTCQLEQFFTTDICVGSPSCPQIESQIPPSLPLALASFLPCHPAHSESANKQGRGSRHPKEGIPPCSKLYSCHLPAPPSPPLRHPCLGDMLPIINKHEAERSHSEIWRHFENSLIFSYKTIEICSTVK